MENKKIYILVVGRDERMLRILKRQIETVDNWAADITTDDTEAIQLMSLKKYEIMLLSSGISDESEDLLLSNLTRLSPETRRIQHYGGGSGLLFNEIVNIISM